jgi:hypothetical protein
VACTSRINTASQNLPAGREMYVNRLKHNKLPLLSTPPKSLTNCTCDLSCCHFHCFHPLQPQAVICALHAHLSVRLSHITRASTQITEVLMPFMQESQPSTQTSSNSRPGQARPGHPSRCSSQPAVSCLQPSANHARMHPGC